MDEYEKLILQLEGGDESQTIAAAHALGGMGDSRAVPVLIRLLKGARSGAIRNAAAVGLRDLGDSAALPTLLALIKDPQLVNDRGTLVYALEGLDIRPILPDVCALICEGNYEVAAMAVGAIAAMPGPLPRSAREAAEAILQQCLIGAEVGSWRREMIEQSLDTIESLSDAES